MTDPLEMDLHEGPLERRITELEKYVKDNHARIRGLRDANKELWEALEKKKKVSE